MLKKFFVFSLILAIFCSSVFALPRKEASLEVATEPVTESSEISSEPVTEVSADVTVTSEDVTQISTGLEELLTKLEGKFLITGSTLNNLKAEFTTFKEDYGTLKEDYESVKVDYEALKKELAKKDSLKYFTNIGCVFGLYDGFGVVGNLGVRKGKAALSVGASYMWQDLNDLINIASHDWSAENVQMQVCLGWEWN